MSLLNNWRFWVGCTISMACLWLALRHVPVAELGYSVARANLSWLLLAIALQLLAVIARAQRWVVLLGEKGRLADSFWAQGVGYLFTNVLPLRMGEPARVIIMGERCKLPIMQVAASALVERVLDVVTIVLALILVLPWMNVPTLVIRTGMTFGLLSLTAIIVSLLAVRFGSGSERLLQYLFKAIPALPIEAIIGRWRELIIGLSPLARWQVAWQGVVWSLASWAFSIGMYWCVLRSFQPDGSLVEAVFMVVALSFAVTVPSSPGFVGIFQLVGQQALVLPFGAKYEATNALAITMTAHLIYYLLTTLLGIIGLWQLGESFGNLGRMIKSKKLTGKTTTRRVTS
jgi:glycosyltransferase 2 family protein